MNIAVTGAAGLVGSNFVTHMLGRHRRYPIHFAVLMDAGDARNLSDMEALQKFQDAIHDVADSLNHSGGSCAIGGQLYE